MSLLEILVFLLSLVTYAVATPVVLYKTSKASTEESLSFTKRGASDFIFDGDAPFSVAADDLAATLTCPYGTPTKDSPPVLLVHGTVTTGKESWGDGYVPALKGNGYTACYITIPNRSMGDMQVNAEYVAYNLHYLSQLSGGLPTAVISHSQGGPNTQWALQFWPSTRNVTSMFIALSPDFSGIDLLGSTSLLHDICASGLCEASLWQQSSGSNYYNALHSHNFSAQVPTTTIWTQFDGVVVPTKANAQLSGATVWEVQSLCPLRPDSHVTMTISAAAYALALDTLKHDGVGSMARVRKGAVGICTMVAAKGMNLDIVNDVQDLLENLVKGLILATPKLNAEPAIVAYAQ